MIGSHVYKSHQEGMTLRDYFAGQAIAGLLADPTFNASHDDAAKLAGRIADAMLAERVGK
jgi:hypothetical protein